MILQSRTRASQRWVTVAVFAPADIETVQAAAAMVSSVSDVGWRMLGEGERVLCIYDGARWRTESAVLGASLWFDGPRAAGDTMPAVLDGFPATHPLDRGAK